MARDAKLVLVLMAVCFLVQQSLGNRDKRGTSTCPAKFAKVSPDHTACLVPPRRPRQGTTWVHRRNIINFHNNLRGSLGTNDGQPVPNNMQRMVWDWGLAGIAQRWAQNCIFAHDENHNRHIPGRFTVGQNIAKSSKYSWLVATNLWWSEINDFTYGEDNQKVVGHYTQMAWAESSRLGCGYALCNNTVNFYVCNYGPAGNTMKPGDPLSIYRPYQTGGDRGSACPNTRTSGLCNCRGRTCNYGGVLDVNTCKCTCLQRDWIFRHYAGYCKFNCGKAKDGPECESVSGPGAPYKQDSCGTYFDVGYKSCPVMCRWCPLKDGTYWEPGEALLTTVKKVENLGTTAAVDTSLKDCTAVDVAKCGQPSSEGYWPSNYCMYSAVESSCLAMCGKCLATSCVSHEGKTYNLGQKWVNAFGRFTCTQTGVTHEQGCEVAGAFVASESSYAYEEGFTTWTCTCTPTDGGGHSLKCSGS